MIYPVLSNFYAFPRKVLHERVSINSIFCIFFINISPVFTKFKIKKLIIDKAW
jgi:hypothetical protein